MSGPNLMPRLRAEQRDEKASMDGDESDGGSVMRGSQRGSGWRKISCSAGEITC